jgi:hypothetical protein
MLESLRIKLVGLGLAIPAGDMPVFINNFFLSGLMVWADAAIFLVAAMLLVKPGRRFAVITLIVLAHAIYGFLGLLILSAEMTYVKLSIGIVIAITSYAGLRFITEGLDGDDEGSPRDDARIINLGIFSFSALALYSAVSIDELFAVLQRYQWMEAQGWNDAVKAANIGASMVVLFGLLWFVKWALEKGISLAWLKKHDDKAMFIVFGLVMYYIVRGIVQNGLGYVPLEIPLTGIAPELLLVGFVLTWGLKQLLKKEALNRLLNKFFLLG